jgi:hypothetical protein
MRGADGTWDGDARPLANLAEPVEYQDAATKKYVDEAAGTTQTVGVWNFSTNLTIADPATGNVRFNNAVEASVTVIALAAVSDNGTDFVAFLREMKAGDWLTFQDQADSTRAAKYEVTTNTDQTTWFQFAVTFLEETGASFIINNNNLAVRLTRHTVITPLAALEARVAALEAKVK